MTERRKKRRSTAKHSAGGRQSGKNRNAESRPGSAAKQAQASADEATSFSFKEWVLTAGVLLVIFATVGTWGQFDFSDLMGYYGLLADAFLKGELHIELRPDQTYLHDMIPYQGRYYLQWGPFPALLHLGAKLMGLTLSDRVACILAGWLTALVFLQIMLVLRRRFFRDVPKALILWFFFVLALVTPTTLVALRGTAYHESIVVGALCVLAGFWALLEYQDRLTAGWACACGAFIGVAMLTRVTLSLYGLVLFGFFVAIQYVRKRSVSGAVVHLGAYGLPLVAAGLLQLGYNQARFGSPWDYGNSYLPNATGQAPFQLSRVPENFKHYLLALPTVGSDFPWIEHVGWTPRVETLRAEDMSSMFITSPFIVLAGLCGLLWRRQDESRELRLFVAFAAAASGAVFLSLLTFASASRRYMQDFSPIWMVLAFVGTAAYLSRHTLSRWWKPVGSVVLACLFVLHLHLLFTMPFNWDPPDINVMRTFVSLSGTVRSVLPGPRLDREEAIIRNDMGTLALKQGLYQEAVGHLKIGRRLMPRERRIKQNLELAETFLVQQESARGAQAQ